MSSTSWPWCWTLLQDQSQFRIQAPLVLFTSVPESSERASALCMHALCNVNIVVPKGTDPELLKGFYSIYVKQFYFGKSRLYLMAAGLTLKAY